MAQRKEAAAQLLLEGKRMRPGCASGRGGVRGGDNGGPGGVAVRVQGAGHAQPVVPFPVVVFHLGTAAPPTPRCQAPPQPHPPLDFDALQLTQSILLEFLISKHASCARNPCMRKLEEIELAHAPAGNTQKEVSHPSSPKDPSRAGRETPLAVTCVLAWG